MITEGLTYEELFECIKLFATEQRLQVLRKGYEHTVNELAEECGNTLVAKTMLVMGLGTFMLADGKLEDDEFDLLKSFFEDDFTEDELIHTLSQVDTEVTEGFEDFISRHEYDFMDQFVLMGIVLCSVDCNITDAETALANRYLSALIDSEN